MCRSSLLRVQRFTCLLPWCLPSVLTSRFSTVGPVRARAKSVPGRANGLDPQAPRPKASCVSTVEPVAPQRKPKAHPLHTSLDQTSQNPFPFQQEPGRMKDIQVGHYSVIIERTTWREPKRLFVCSFWCFLGSWCLACSTQHSVTTCHNSNQSETRLVNSDWLLWQPITTFPALPTTVEEEKYSACIIIMQVDILIIYINLYTVIVHKGWKWKTPYIQVCIIIKQVFFYR